MPLSLRMRYIEKYYFYAVLIACILLLTVPKFYITGDGPSHVYNAHVLFQYLHEDLRAFYKPFYQINKSFDPNWSSHIILGVFTRFLPAWFADKAFQLFYLFVFAFGFRYLIRSIQKDNEFIALFFAPFVFTLPFQQGFYNYCLALAFLWWIVGYYIRHYENLQIKHVSFLMLGLLVITFTHGMPSVWAIVIMTLLSIFSYQSLLQKNTIIDWLAAHVIMFLPSIILIVAFMFKKGIDVAPHHQSIFQKWLLFISGDTLQIFTHTEKWIIIPLIICWVISFISLIKKVTYKIISFHPLSLVMLCMLLFALYSYLTAPHSIGGAGAIDIRLGFLPWIFLLCLLANLTWQRWLKTTMSVVAIVYSVVILIIRLPIMLAASHIGQEMMAATNYIQPQSVVMNLHMDDWHVNENGDSLFQKDGSFIHFTDYIGAEKPLILINNYEAELHYFPVQWRPDKNPFYIIPNLLGGHYPPAGNLMQYERKTLHKINYVLIQQWNDKYLQQHSVKQLMDTIHSYFTIKFSSPKREIVLWQRKQEM